MSDTWFYTHAGTVHGPVATEHLLRLVATGGLLPDDRIWPESVDPAAAVLAEAALSFPASVPSEASDSASRPAPLPEWIRALTNAGLDVAGLESLASPLARAWLDDVRRLEQAPRPTPKPADDRGPKTWPVSQDYNEAVQSPAANFADADLRSGQAVTNALGIPQPCSGNFAERLSGGTAGRPALGREMLHAPGGRTARALPPD